MTHFEYIFVAVSIVLSFTLLRLLDAVPTAFSRTRGYWVHAVWVAFLLFLCAAFWWLSWFHRNLNQISFGYFLFLLAAPSVLFLAATSLVSASPPSVSDWHKHFFRVRLRFFLGILFYVSILVVNSFANLNVPIEHPIRRGQAVVVAMLLAGVVFRSERAHAAIAGFAATCLALLMLLAAFGRLPMTLE
jgi:hypothetical protein